MPKNKFKIVGTNVVREDGRAKVTGRAKFADDYRFPGQLYAFMIRSREAHAKIIKIDYSKIIGSRFLTAVCDADDIPGRRKVGPVRNDQPIFSFDKVVTSGDVIAMLVGPSREKLSELALMVLVDYERLPLLTDPLKALSKKSPLIHPDYGNNLIVHHKLRKGNVRKGFEESYRVIGRTYSTSLVEHAYIEPETVTAVPGRNGRLKIIGSIQNPHTVLKVVCEVLNEKPEYIEVVQAELGGSFGGKDDIMSILSARAAIAARKVNRPVKIKYTREESVVESYKRHPYTLKYRVGFDKSGRIKAMNINILADGGAYASMSPFVTWRSVVEAGGPYKIDNIRTDVKAVYTNNPYTGAFRGFGSPQPIFAVESIIDEIAAELKISPLEIRRRNILSTGSMTATGQSLVNHEVTLNKILLLAEKRNDFTARYRYNLKRNKNNGKLMPSVDSRNFKKESLLLRPRQFIAPKDKIKRGIGLAISYRGCSLGAEGIDEATAIVKISKNGNVKFITGLAENGQGLRTTFSIIISEVLGISPDHISAMEQSTRIAPDSGPTVASRATLMGGGAIKSAAERLRDRISEFLRNKYCLTNETMFDYKDNFIFWGPGKKKIKFTDAVYSAFNNKINLSASSVYKAPPVTWNEKTGQGDAYFTYVYGCQVAEVEVNISTGEVFVNKIKAFHDPGRVINKSGAEGQIYGGVTQGLGYALMEEINPIDGWIREDNFDQVLIPTAEDVGDIIPCFIEGKDNHGAWGAKSIGEPTLEITAAAVANAVYNATGIRYYNLPLNLEEILLGFKLKQLTRKRGSIS